MRLAALMGTAMLAALMGRGNLRSDSTHNPLEALRSDRAHSFSRLLRYGHRMIVSRQSFPATWRHHLHGGPVCMP